MYSHFAVFTVCVCLLALGSETSGGQLRGSKWIWHAGVDAPLKTPAETTYFRRPLIIPDDKPVVSATCTITADNEFKLFLNGRLIGSGDNWQNAYAFDLKDSLNTGENVLAVEAINWDGPGGNPAGWIASLNVRLADGAALTIRSDEQWKSSATETKDWQARGFDDSAWKKVRVVIWNGWNAVMDNTGTLRAHDPLVEPETRRLTAEEGETILTEEWLFQAEDKPLDQRALQ